MNILGINSVYHDSAAALLVDGALVAAVEEERFSRIKHAKLANVDNPHQFPERAIRFCLDYAGLTAGDIDHVAYSFDPRLRRTRFRAEWWADPRFEEAFLLRLGQVRGVAEELLGRPLRQRFHFVPHHLYRSQILKRRGLRQPLRQCMRNCEPDHLARVNVGGMRKKDIARSAG